MGRWHRNPWVWAAWAVLAFSFLLPVGAMFVRSVQLHEVVTTSGDVFRAVGEVQVGDEEVTFAMQAGPGAERQPWSIELEDLAEVRTVLSLDHYRHVLGDARTVGLLRNSAWIAFGGALLALLLGVPIAWILARTDLRGRALLAALCLGPMILPPFFIALGGARAMQEVLIDVFAVEGGTLQILNSILVFGCVLYPLYILLVGRALLAVPAGPWEAARLLRGPGAAFRHVVLPTMLPATVGAFVLAFLLALTDFAVPDVLGFMLPAGGTPTHVFATEVLLQWKQKGNAGRAVATAAPFVLLTVGLLAASLFLLRRGAVFGAGRADRRRPRYRLGLSRSVLAYALVLGVLGVSLILPLAGIGSWAGGGAESSAGGTENPSASSAGKGSLFDFRGTLDRTEGSREERDRWLATGIAAALLAMFVAVPLARQATRGGRLAQSAVLIAGSLPLAVPGLVLSAGTLIFWQGLPDSFAIGARESILRSTLVLSAKFLPFALLAAWLSLRQVRRGHEEVAAALGAGWLTRGWRILRPATTMGVLSGGLVVLVLALRELDSVILIDARILPMRLYDKIHFNRMADEANLLFLCLAYLLVPALVCAALVALRRRRSG